MGTSTTEHGNATGRVLGFGFAWASLMTFGPHCLCTRNRDRKKFQGMTMWALEPEGRFQNARNGQVTLSLCTVITTANIIIAPTPRHPAACQTRAWDPPTVLQERPGEKMVFQSHVITPGVPQELAGLKRGPAGPQLSPPSADRGAGLTNSTYPL